MEEATSHDLRDAVEIHVRAAIQVTQSLIPGMRGAAGDESSTWPASSRWDRSNRTTYGAAKGALIALTRGWAAELGVDNITVERGRARGHRHRPSPRQLPGGQRGGGPLSATNSDGRGSGIPSEVASVIAFLCSEEASYVTGQVIYIDGGFSAGPGDVLDRARIGQPIG